DAGQLEVETTDLEIVAVDAADQCVREGLWQLDISATRSVGRHRFTARYEGGVFADVQDGALDPASEP
ncbi:MAG: hypothetical protein KC457_32990, partial [Myxococcales bacterium]|nr:hypothetical protein [Myxococcales bacterium]